MSDYAWLAAVAALVLALALSAPWCSPSPALPCYSGVVSEYLMATVDKNGMRMIQVRLPVDLVKLLGHFCISKGVDGHRLRRQEAVEYFLRHGLERWQRETIKGD